MSTHHIKLCWKVLNWNIRGLNDKDKWTIIYDKIQESGCHIICFQETKRESITWTFSEFSVLRDLMGLLISHLLVGLVVS
jgi:hypothetical protein